MIHPPHGAGSNGWACWLGMLGWAAVCKCKCKCNARTVDFGVQPEHRQHQLLAVAAARAAPVVKLAARQLALEDGDGLVVVQALLGEPVELRSCVLTLGEEHVLDAAARPKGHHLSSAPAAA
eukprot:scaffold50486_cov76-Phaeocystis_antarctica.AAC.2